MSPLWFLVFIFSVVTAAPSGNDQSNDIMPDGIPTEINMAGLNLTALPDASEINPLTKILNVSLNDITNATDELVSFSNLEVLILRFNQLTSLSFLPQPCGLIRLDASRNNISDLEGPLADCVWMESLNLTANQISAIPDDLFARLTRLKVLYLAKNKLETLPNGLFASLYNLERLRLNANRLKVLPADVFFGLHALRYLDVSLNNLTTLPLLEDCCEMLQGAYFKNNSIRAPSEAAMRAFLRGNSSKDRDMAGNPLLPAALVWATRDPLVRLFVHDDVCACGLLHHAPTRASVILCVDVRCGANATYANWVAAVKAEGTVQTAL